MRVRTVCGSFLVALFAFGPPTVGAQGLTPVPAANTKTSGVVMPNVLSPELAEIARATGSMLLENPVSPAKYYGYNDDKPNLVPLPPPAVFNVEAHKTEPDKNTYLVLGHQKGADPAYDYGTHFLFQGHESGPGIFPNQQGYITRINLDADVAHRVTLMATTDVQGNPLPTFDGSTWYPWAQRLLFTAELGGVRGGVWQATLDVPSMVEDISGALGRGGYEGIQADQHGNLWIVEDTGGRFGTVNSHARQPNSFVFRFVPYNRGDLRDGGKLQVLAVKSKAHAGNIVFNNADADIDILSQDAADLHTYGLVFDITWIAIHDTATQGNTPFDANAAAKGVGTPFKRPENGVFRPSTDFREFYFTETGDTSALTEAGSGFGGFGGLFKISQRDPADDHGTLRLFYLGNVAHTGLDNLAFVTKDHLIVVEDAGDTLHTQRNALDSAYLFEVHTDYSVAVNQPIRILAQGRDASATIDSALLGTSGFTNDGDNEITGIHVSDGDPTVGGILGAKIPQPFDGKWRIFYTQQHGDNITYEIIADPAAFADNERADNGQH